ncbi:hypothetical protein BGW41_007063 [Actinomortierella wolfii]|nr:hypothetical protein BGW41_007063 [Actinomortierella wolfii]
MNAFHAPPLPSIPDGGDGERGPPPYPMSPTAMTSSSSLSFTTSNPTTTTAAAEPVVAMTTAVNIHRNQQQQAYHHQAETAAISTSLALSPEDQAWLSEALNSTLLRLIDFDSITDKRMDVARGGYGTIHAGKWRNSLVAVKVLHVPTDFIQEVRIHKRVGDCENVIKCWGVTWIESARVYGMVLQFAAFGSLRDFLREHFNRLDWHRKIRLARDVAMGLRFIHEEDVCHHDLHSRNVLIDHNKRALITDFGLSRNQPQDEMRQHSAGPRGVVPYISPERLSSNSFNHSSDIYSLGVIMWELTSGRPPFSDNSELPFMLAFHILNGLRETVVEGTPEEYATLYQRCWDKEPTARPSLDEIINTLDRILTNQRSSSVSSPHGGASGSSSGTNKIAADSALGDNLAHMPEGVSSLFATATTSLSMPTNSWMGLPNGPNPANNEVVNNNNNAIIHGNESPRPTDQEKAVGTPMSAPVQTSTVPLQPNRPPPATVAPHHHPKAGSSEGTTTTKTPSSHSSHNGSNSNSQQSVYSAYSNGSNNSNNSYDLYLSMKKMQLHDHQQQQQGGQPTPHPVPSQHHQHQQQQQQHEAHNGGSPVVPAATVAPLKPIRVTANPVIIPPLQPRPKPGSTGSTVSGGVSPYTQVNGSHNNGSGNENSALLQSPTALQEGHEHIESRIEAAGQRLQHTLKEAKRPPWIQPATIPTKDNATYHHNNHHGQHHTYQQQQQQTSPTLKHQTASPLLQQQQLYQQQLLQQQGLQQQAFQHSPPHHHYQIHQGTANGHSGHIVQQGQSYPPHVAENNMYFVPPTSSSPSASPRPINTNLNIAIGSPTMYPTHLPLPMGPTTPIGGALPTEMPVPHIPGKGPSVSTYRPHAGIYPPPAPVSANGHVAHGSHITPSQLSSPPTHNQHLVIATNTSSQYTPGTTKVPVHPSMSHPSPLSGSGSFSMMLPGSATSRYIPRDGKATLQSFHRACFRGDVEAVQWHLFQGCDPMEPDREMSHRTALHRAVLNENHEVLKLLVESAGPRINLDERDDSKQTPLHILTQYGTDAPGFHQNLVYLLRRGANPNALDSERRTPLMTTMILLDNAQFVETLLDYGADPRIKCMNNNALAEAATRHRYECVKVLLDTELSMSEPESLSRAMDVCYNVRESEEGNKILALLVRCRDTPEGERKRRTLAWMILKGERFGERRIDQTELARKVVMVAENSGGVF